MSLTEQNMPGTYLLLYDGVCALCNGLVRFIIRRDSRGNFRFAPLQGETAQQYPVPNREQMNTVVLVIRHPDKQTIFIESDAVLFAVIALGGLWKIARLGLILPRFFRDGIYRFIALRRYRWFGKYESCPLPPAEWRERFLS